MLKIKTASDPVSIETLIVMLYGQPSSGKTTLGFSADKSLLLDFDSGFYRAKNIQNYVPVKCWEDVSKISKEELKDFNTIVIDTVGRALDSLQSFLIDNDSKLARRDGALTLQGYGALKASFTTWIKMLRNLGKDIIFLSHVKEDKDGDVTVLRPQIQGGTFDFIMQISDFVGYTYFINKKRFIDFNPCEKWHGKNSADFEAMEIPDYQSNTQFLAELIQRMKSRLSELSESQKQTLMELNEYNLHINELNGVEDFNDFYVVLREKNPPKALKAQIWDKLTNKALQHNAKFNKQTNLFEVA